MNSIMHLNVQSHRSLTCEIVHEEKTPPHIPKGKVDGIEGGLEDEARYWAAH